MADNSALAMQFGMEGPSEKGYEMPEIIEGMMEYLKANDSR